MHQMIVELYNHEVSLRQQHLFEESPSLGEPLECEQSESYNNRLSSIINYEDSFGIDPVYIESLPSDMREELYESFMNQNLGNFQSNPVQRQEEAMDVASIMQSAATP